MRNESVNRPDPIEVLLGKGKNKDGAYHMTLGSFHDLLRNFKLRSNALVVVFRKGGNRPFEFKERSIEEVESGLPKFFLKDTFSNKILELDDLEIDSELAVSLTDIKTEE
jgi:hypothetical protein